MSTFRGGAPGPLDARRADRAEELLVTRLTEGLDVGSDRELDELLEDVPQLDVLSFELAVAAVELACWYELETESEPMPPDLRARLAGQAPCADPQSI